MDKFKKYGFTLAEVLVTLGVIGIVAALTMPTLMANHQKTVQKAQFKKAYSLFYNAVMQAQAELGYPVYCTYWDRPTACTAKCTKNNEYGTCVSWTCSDGTPLPTNYNGLRANCDKFEEQLFTKTLKVIKSCPTKALENGCLTDEYRGTDKVKQELNSSNPDYKADPNIDFSDTNIKNKYSAWVLSNGMVIFKYGTYKSNYPIYTIDINGHKKPNKWGHDIFTFTLKGNEDGITSMVGSTYATEKGGKSATQMINEQ